MPGEFLKMYNGTFLNIDIFNLCSNPKRHANIKSICTKSKTSRSIVRAKFECQAGEARKYLQNKAGRTV